MNGPDVEQPRRPRTASAVAQPRLFYTFRPRVPRGPEDVLQRIETCRNELARVREGTSAAAEIHREIGMLLTRAGRERESLIAYERGLAAARAAGDHHQAGRALMSIGLLRARRGECEPAIECFFDAIREAIEAGDARSEAAAWMEIASVFSESGKLDQALESLERSIALLEHPGDAYLQARARVSAASVLVALARATEAVDHATRALVALECFDEYAGQVEALLVLGRSYRHLGDLQTAAGFIERGAELARVRAHIPGVAASLLALAEVRRDERRIHEALAVIEEAIAVASEGGSIELEWRMHELAAELAEESGDAGQALAHTRIALDTREASLERVRDERFDDLRVRHEALQLGRERDALRREASQLRQALADANRQLTEASLSLVRKSELLDEVRHQLGDIVDTTAERTSSIVLPILDELACGSSEDSWRMFEQQFDSIHNDFARRLAEHCPSLTPMELKVSLLTRLDLTAKEVARLMHVSERNVQNHRYRLRKKLGLAPEENLATFLAGV